MKDDADLLPVTAAAAVAAANGSPAATTAAKKDASVAGDGGKGGRRYKFWALAAIILLAFWSMLTGTVSLRSSAPSLRDDFLDVPHRREIDVLEMEEREKVVRHMWDVYTQRHGQRMRLPRFWQEAFEAAYEDLASDDQEVREAAVAEIVRMSMRMLDMEQPSHTSTTHHIHKHDGGAKSRRIGRMEENANLSSNAAQ